MIFDVIFWLGGAVLNIIATLFGVLQFVIPQQFFDAFDYFLSFSVYLDALLPLETFFTAAGVLVSFFTLYYSIKVVQWAWHHVPWFGKHKSLPTVKGRSLHNK